MNLNEYKELMLEEIRMESNVNITDVSSEFIRYVTDILISAEEFDDFTETYFEVIGKSNRRVQIDGFSFDEIDKTGIERLRFATSHPKDLTDEVIADFGTLPSLMPYLHLPVQSGSNRILSEMNRRYTREHYLELVQKIRKACPDIALSTDIIVGFPGETEDDFMDTYRLVEEVGYQQVFTFIYSKREGTPAADMVDDTPHEVIQERFDRLVDLVQSKAYEANQADASSVVSVLVEGVSKRDESLFVGKSCKNQTVHAPIPAGRCIDDLVGKTIDVQVEEARTWYLFGHVVDDNER